MTNETKGITVKIAAELHAQVREYVESHGMTMAEFVSQALDNELHPKYQMQEEYQMANRTIAFQVPEELYQRIKDYLSRNNMTQKQFFLGLVEAELERDETEQERLRAETQNNRDEEIEEHSESGDDPARADEQDQEEADNDETEEHGFSLSM